MTRRHLPNPSPIDMAIWGLWGYKMFSMNPEDERVRLAKKWGKAHGFRGAQGGWIYNAAGRPVAQGWLDFYSKFQAKIMAQSNPRKRSRTEPKWLPASRVREFDPNRFDIRWNQTFTKFRAIPLRWWDDASYAAYQARDLFPEQNPREETRFWWQGRGEGVAFTTDKRGRPIALQLTRGGKYFRVPLDEARSAIAAGENKEIEYIPIRPQREQNPRRMRRATWTPDISHLVREQAWGWWIATGTGTYYGPYASREQAKSQIGRLDSLDMVIEGKVVEVAPPTMQNAMSVPEYRARVRREVEAAVRSGQMTEREGRRMIGEILGKIPKRYGR